MPRRALRQPQRSQAANVTEQGLRKCPVLGVELDRAGSTAPAAKAAAAKGFMFSPAVVAAAAVVEAGAGQASDSSATDRTNPPAPAEIDAPAAVTEAGAGGNVSSAPLPSATDPSPTIGVVTEAPASTHGAVYIVENARTFLWASNKLNGNDVCEHYRCIEKAKGALRAGLPAVHRDLHTIQLTPPTPPPPHLSTARWPLVMLLVLPTPR